MFSIFAKKQKSCYVKVIVVDFYDSFTYNLVHYIESLDCQVTVVLEDLLAIDDLAFFDAVILSPGPGLPEEKINLFKILEFCQSKIPVLGICLGMQGVAQFLGFRLENQNVVKHGVSEKIEILNFNGLFQGFPKAIDVGLYHSWKVISEEDHEITAKSKQGIYMAIEIPEKKLFGVQFHPESIMTPFGREILRNFLFRLNF